jgi:hypothetical protein
MPIVTLEGVIEHGQIRLRPPVPLPENTKVYVVIPDLRLEPSARLVSPRLVHPEQVADFQMEVSEDASDADV